MRQHLFTVPYLESKHSVLPAWLPGGDGLPPVCFGAGGEFPEADPGSRLPAGQITG